MVKITREDVASCQTTLNIELEESDLSEYLDKGYRRIVQRITIQGFRKGKAPRLVVEGMVGRNALLQEVTDFMLPEITRRAVVDQDIEIVGSPSVELLDLEPVKIKATLALPPNVDIDKYKEIRVEDKTIEITDTDIDDRLQKLRTESSTWEPVDRSVKLNDMLTIDVVGHVGENNIINENGTAYVPEKDSTLPFPGFADHLTDVDMDTQKEFTIKIPDDYHDSSLAGKDAHFAVKVTEIKERQLPELDDEFAKTAGDGFSTLVELRESIANELNVEAAKTQASQYKETALGKLVELANIDLAPMLIDREVEYMVARRNQFVERLNIQLEDYLRIAGKTEEQIEKEMREEAVATITRTYALDKLSEIEELSVTDDEIEQELARITSENGDQVDNIKERDPDSEELKRSIRHTLLIGKALDRLAEIAKGNRQIEEPDENPG